MLQESGGRVVFDLDVTAEIRPGYFGVPDVGPIFIENRYTDFHRYWPHQGTLRNLRKRPVRGSAAAAGGVFEQRAEHAALRRRPAGPRPL